MTKEIIKDGIVLARKIDIDSIRDELSFFSKEDEFIQAGMWNYNAGKKLNAHIHNCFERISNRTQEALFVLEGEILAKIYDLNENFVEEISVKKNQILILLNSGHSYEILKDNTRVLEFKNGPYFGAETDRKRF